MEEQKKIIEWETCYANLFKLSLLINNYFDLVYSRKTQLDKALSDTFLVLIDIDILERKRDESTQIKKRNKV